MKKILVLLLLILAVSLSGYDTFYELIEDHSAGLEIDNFIGYVEMDSVRLADFVPESFPHHDTAVLIEEEYEELIYDEDGNESNVTKTRMVPQVVDGETIMRAKTWLEYAKLIYPSDHGVKLTVGWRDDNGNMTHVVTSEEFYLWADYWGIENFILPNDNGIKTITQMPIKGQKRMVIGANPAIDTSRLVAVTVNNASISPFYQVEGIEFNQDILNLLMAAQQTGATTVTMDELLGYTTVLINIDNVTPQILNFMILFNGAIWVDWLDQHDLYMEVDLPNDEVTFTKGDKGLVPLKGKDWDYIRTITNPLVWDKYTSDWLR